MIIHLPENFLNLKMALISNLIIISLTKLQLPPPLAKSLSLREQSEEALLK